tara:strand:+ start:3428 stop:4042 length:615 start_codon:yes stop_codon:yes gene_type:complete
MGLTLNTNSLTSGVDETAAGVTPEQLTASTQWELIERTTISSSLTYIDYTASVLTSSLHTYKVHYNRVRFSSSDYMGLRWLNGTVPYTTGVYTTGGLRHAHTSGGLQAVNFYSGLGAAYMTYSSTNRTINAELEIQLQPNESNGPIGRYRSSFVQQNQTGYMETDVTSIGLQGTPSSYPVDGFRLMPAGGSNFESGTISVYKFK